MNWPRRATVKTLALPVGVDVEDLDRALEHEEEIDRSLAALERRRPAATCSRLP